MQTPDDAVGAEAKTSSLEDAHKRPADRGQIAAKRSVAPTEVYEIKEEAKGGDNAEVEIPG